MSDRFQEWSQAVKRLDPLIGSGSPEGVLEAFPFRFYIDTNGASSTTLYIKIDPDDGAGDRRFGWRSIG